MSDKAKTQKLFQKYQHPLNLLGENIKLAMKDANIRKHYYFIERLKGGNK